MELLYDFLFILGVILCLTFIFILHKNNKNNELPHKILISILVIFIFIFLNSYASINKVWALSSFTISVVLSAKIFTPTLLFFYIKSLFFEDKQILKGHKIMLVFPLFFLLAFIIPNTILISIINSLYLFNYYDALEEIFDIMMIYVDILELIRIISNIVAIIYLTICLIYFFKLKKVMESTYSYIANNNFVWIRFLLIFPLLMVCVDSILALIEYAFYWERWKTTEIFNSSVLTLFILVMGYFGLNQTKIFVPYFLLENNIPNTKNSIPLKNEIPNIQHNAEYESLEKELKNIFETEKLFLNTDLTLSKLAKAIGTTDKKISTLLNQHLQISFYEFVNNYRVEAFKNALQNNQYENYTIEAISYECGFKSKASFYRIFKSKMNMSPSAYKNSLV